MSYWSCYIAIKEFKTVKEKTWDSEANEHNSEKSVKGSHRVTKVKTEKQPKQLGVRRWKDILGDKADISRLEFI